MKPIRRNRSTLLLVFTLSFLLGCRPQNPTTLLPPPVTIAPSPTQLEPTDSLTDDQVATLNSLEKVNNFPLYTMHYFGVYSTADPLLSKITTFHSTPPLSWGCSLFAALGNGENDLFGRNFDWRYSPLLVLFNHPLDGYASVSIVDIEYLEDWQDVTRLIELPLAERVALLEAPQWPIDGMNEHGLAIGMAAVSSGDMTADPDRPTTGSLSIMRLILDHAKNVTEALEIFDSYNIDMLGGPDLHYLVADTSGDAVLVEFSRGKMVTTSQGDQPWHQATNFLRAEAGQSARGLCWRYDAIHERLSNNAGSLKAVDALDLLAQVSQDSTQWSVVYDMDARGLDIAVGRDYNTVHTFTLFQSDE